jgi:hypothetical protein
LAFLCWKTYTYIKLKQWWKNESTLSRQIIEFITERLNEGVNSKYFWVKSLAVSEMAEFAKDYRVLLMARPLVIEKESADLVEGWIEWAATRLDEYVFRMSADELAENMGSEEEPIPMMRVLIAKAAFEIVVSEYALSLLNIADARKRISGRITSNELKNMDPADIEKDDLAGNLARANRVELVSMSLKFLGKELGERA